MFAAQYNTEGDQDIFILNDAPRWTDGVLGTFSVVSDQTVGLTQREARRPVSASLRLELSYSSVVVGASFHELENALRSYQNLPVIMPFWPGMVRWADRASAPIQSGRMIAWKPDWSSWGISTWDTDLGFAADDWVAPALWGRLDRRDIISFRPEAGTFSVKFVETSKFAWALAPAAVTWATGPTPGTGWSVAPDVIPLKINFNRPNKTITFEIAREQIGFGRAPAETVYPQANKRNQSIDHVGQGRSAISQIVRFFMDHGSGSAFWASQWTESLRLTAPIGSGDTVIHVEDSSQITAGDFLTFSSFGTIKHGRTVSKTSTTVTLSASLGTAFPVSALVSQLVLSRFDKTTISLSWVTPDYAKCSISLIELSAEYITPADETHGTTISYLPMRAWLYEFTRIINGSTVTSAYTSHEQNLSSGSYIAQTITHGTVTRGLFLDADGVELKSFAFAGNPMLDLAAMRMEVPLYVTIKTVDVSGTTISNSKTIFYGEVTSASVHGSLVVGKAIAGGSLFDRQIPRCRFQTTCNNSLFDLGCGQGQANWSWTCFIHADEVQGTLSIQVDTLTHPVAHNPTLVANFFALGWIEVLGQTGPPYPFGQRPVLTSTAVSGGIITLAIDRNFYPLVKAGDGCLLMPGCDGSASTCRDKFGNYKNFLGHPFLPVANPSLIKNTTNSSGGGKK